MEPQHRPRIIILAGLILIGACVLLVSLGVFMCMYPRLMAGTAEGGLLILLGGVIIFWEYRLVFCCPAVTARNCYGCLTLLAVATSYELLNGMFIHLGEYAIAIYIVCVALFLVDFMALWNTIHRRRLVKSKALTLARFFSEASPLFRDYRTREIFGVITIFVLVVFITGYQIQKNPPRRGENCSFEQLPDSFSGLPREGFDFKFQTVYPYTKQVCEFSISEDDFKKWVAHDEYWEACVELSEYRIPTYARLTGEKTIKGLQTIPFTENHGPCAVFDRRTNRAYYWRFRWEQ